jgi:hypothetical protein
VGVMPRFPDTSASCYGRPSPGASVPVTGNLGVHGLFGRSPVISVLTATKESATEPELPIRIDAHLGLNRRQPAPYSVRCRDAVRLSSVAPILATTLADAADCWRTECSRLSFCSGSPV